MLPNLNSGKVTGYASPPSYLPRRHKNCSTRTRYYVPNLESLIKGITFKSATCAQVNPKVERKTPQGIWAQRNEPEEYLELDFTEI